MSDKITNTTTIILFLLVITMCIMVYNYLIIYIYTTRTNVETKSINNEYSAPLNTVTNTSTALNPTNPTNIQVIKKDINEKDINKIDINKIDINKKEFKRSLTPEQGITKLAILHMNGCGHCSDLMEIKQSNGMTKFEQLEEIFKEDPTVQIMDFKSGRDREASKYTSFPIILIITGKGETEYMGFPREVTGIAKAILDVNKDVNK